MNDSNRFKGTILDQRLPLVPVERVHRLARDLAWGAVNGLWQARMIIEGNHLDFIRREDRANFQTYLLKWKRQVPSIHLLSSFGYLEQKQEGQVISGLILQKAFSLLNIPAQEPRIFISYKRDQSSAFALLVEARLRNVGNHNTFIDKNIPAGEKWEQHLQEQIQNSDYFICLIGPETMQSQIVHKEIAWAINSNCKIISMWHRCDMSSVEHLPELDEFNAIQIGEENAEAYETALNKMLNSLGYATY